MRSAYGLGSFLFSCLLALHVSAGEPAYRDPRVPLDERVRDLLARMTLAEKVAQMCQKDVSSLELEDNEVTPASLTKSLDGQSCGTVSCLRGYAPEEISVRVRAAQEYLRTQTRLGITAIPIAECIHGVQARGATVFPQAIAMGSTWNPDLMQEAGAAIAEEASAMGIAQCLSPLFDLARDPRYGRVEECYGECPTLVSRMGVAFVSGAQGRDVSQTGLAPNKILCTAKHFAGYSVPTGGLNCGPASIGEREMRSLHLVPFEAAILEAGVCSVMPSYNEVDGVPAHASRWLLNDVLRGEWGFRGYVFSDYGAIHMLYDYHHVAADASDAAMQAIRAGVDLDAPSATAYKHLEELVQAGKVPEKAIDQAVERILRVKFLAGLFDGARGVDSARLKERIHTPEHIALARRAAEESIILLKNEGNVLPLDPRELKSIAVIGPNADQVQFGDYSATKDNAYGVTVLAGLRASLGKRVRIDYAKGCDLVGTSRGGFAEAVAAARRSDVAIVVIGDTSEMNGEPSLGDEANNRLATVGEGFDTTDLSPPGVQEELVRAVHATGKPVIAVMIHGRPYSIPWMKANVPAIISAFYPGEQGGSAIADILLGRVNPSGRLPLSVPQSAGHIPTVYDFKPTGRGVYGNRGTPEKPGQDYLFTSPDPLFPFGFGLSYTTFAYRSLTIETPSVPGKGVVRLSFVVSNTGPREGREVAQVYIRDETSSTSTPTMRLYRFKKVLLEAGGGRRLAFEIPVSELALWDAAMNRVVEPGRFQVLVGASAEDIRLKKEFEVNQSRTSDGNIRR
jgi:beta-glucosidase